MPVPRYTFKFKEGRGNMGNFIGAESGRTGDNWQDIWFSGVMVVVVVGMVMVVNTGVINPSKQKASPWH